MTEEENVSSTTTPSERDQLKAKFADNQRPTGADFAQFIDATVIQPDDGLLIESNKAMLNKTLAVEGNIELSSVDDSASLNLPKGGQLNADQLNLGTEVSLSADAFKIGEQLQLNRDAQMMAMNSLEVRHQETANDKVTINHTDALLHVDGESQFTGTLRGNEAEFSNQLSVNNNDGVAINVSGASQFNGDLSVAGDADIDGRLTLGDGHNDNDMESSTALLSLQQNSGGDLVNIESDDQQIVIDQRGRLGLGHDNPKNSLDINGSVAISPNAQSLDADYSLIVDEKIGVGTRSPQARMDVLCESHQDALTLRQNDSSILNVRTGMDNSHASLSFSGDSYLEGELTVDKKSTLQQTKVQGKLTVDDELDVKKSIKGESDLTISGKTDLEDSLAVMGEAILDDSLTVKKHSDLAELTVQGSTQLNSTLQVSDSAHLEQTLTLSSDKTVQPNASLHIKEDSSRASLRIDNNNGEANVLVNNQTVQVGDPNQSTELLVHGNTTINDQLTVKSRASIDDGLQVNNGVAVEVVSGLVEDPIETTDKALEVKHDSNTLLVTAPNKVGLLVDDPQADIHLGGCVQVDKALMAKDGLSVSSEALPSTETLMVSDEKIVLDGAPLPQGIMLKGTTQFDGKVKVDQWLTIDQQQLHLQKTGKETALSIQNADHQVTIGADSIALNTDNPQANLHINGTAHIDQQLTVGDSETQAGQFQLLGQAEVKGEAHFADNVLIDKQLGLGVMTPTADIHIGAGDRETTLRIDGKTAEDCQLIVDQGRVGIGTSSPDCALDVADDVFVGGDFTVGDNVTTGGIVRLNANVSITQDTNIQSDLFVLEKSRLREQTILGMPDAENVDIKSQLYIADLNYAEALRIDSKNNGSIVVKEGRIGIGVEEPNQALEVSGSAQINEGLIVNGNTQLEGELEIEDNLIVRDCLEVNKKSEFGSDVDICGDLRVEDSVSIDETLTVAGSKYLDVALNVQKDAMISGSLSVANHTHLQNPVDIDGELKVKDTIRSAQDIYASHEVGVGVDNAQASLHVQSKAEQMPLRIDHQTADNVARNLLTLTNQGDLKTLNIRNTSELQTHSLQLNSGPSVTGISDDVTLGGDHDMHALLPTQAAVKSYIDNVVVPFGRGGKTHTVSSQVEFDRLFNREGHDKTRISDNTTIILMPMNNQDYGTSAYMLRQTVALGSNVSIVGFNPYTTVIRKKNPKARFELIGSASQWVSHVHLEGFTFDGNHVHSTQNGGAFYLEYARDSQLNCHIVNHRVTGHGAGIYANRISADQYSAFNIEALHIRQCQAVELGSQMDNQRNEGGAAWGLAESEIHAEQCQADRGGAVAFCQDSRVVAIGCHALMSGGGAYRCERLVLHARNCRAESLSGDAMGKGGGAYYCSDLLCEGFWRGNNAAEGPHIYANNHLTDAHEERHYWKGDFVGRKIDTGESVWNVHNE